MGNFYCGETLESAGRELQDCTVFRDGPLVIPVSEEFSAETPCVYPDTEVVLHRDCPPNTTYDDEDECVVVCPNPHFSTTQYIWFMTITQIFGWLGLISALAVWFFFITHPWKRMCPRSNPAWQQLYLVPLSLNYILPSLGGGYENVWCTDGHAAQLSDNAYCAVNALLLYFGAWAGVIWYVFVGLSLNLTVWNAEFAPAWVMQAVYHTVAIVWSVAWTVIFISTGDMKNGGYGGCRLDGDQWNEWFQDIFFWIPYCLLMMTGVLLLAVVVLRLVLVMGLKGIREHWRIIAYLFIGLGVVCYTCIYHWVVRIEEDTFRRAVENFIVCGAGLLEPERCDLQGALDFLPYLANIMVVEAVPIAFACILLSDPDIWLHWYDMFRRYILGRDVPDRWTQQRRAEALSKRLQSTDGFSANTMSNADSQG